MKTIFTLASSFLAVTLSLNGAALAGSNDAKTAKSTALEPSPREYLIGADDVLLINVWKETEISRSVLVRPDGKISLPLVGDLSATGLSPVQLRDEIASRLRTYLSDPEVTVIVQEARSQKFNILGEVEHPGSYPLTRSMTVLDAIAVAGGFREFAKGSKIFILRINADGSRTRIFFNYKGAIRGKNRDQSIELEPRDTVVVP